MPTNFLSRLRISSKLLLIVAAPLLALTYFSFRNVVQSAHVRDESVRIIALCQLAEQSGNSIHEIQKERGMSSGFIGSKGAKFARELPEQRRKSDAELAKLTIKTRETATMKLGSLATSIEAALTQLDQISAVRRQVDAQGITAAVAMDYYSNAISLLLQANILGANGTDNGELSRHLMAYVSLLFVKEHTGVERAVLNNTFASGAFGPGIFQRFASQIAKQDAFNQMFQALATPEWKKKYDEVNRLPVTAEVKRIETIAFDRAGAGGFGVEPTYWFKTITEKIDALKEVENYVSKSLLAESEQLERTSRNTFYLLVILTTASFLLSCLLALLVGRRLVRSMGSINVLTTNLSQDLAGLAKVATAVAQNDLTVRVEPSSLEFKLQDDRDEIGDLNRSVANTLHAKRGVEAAMSTMILNLRTMVEGMSASARGLAATANELTASSENLSNGASRQTEQTLQVSAAVEEISATINSMAQNTEVVKAKSADTTHMAHSGSDIVSNMIASTNEIARIIDASVKASSELVASAERIGAITSIIDDIADQTNLLALNAAIEAARAGEQGRGFAVVADEVRKLAEKTTQATSEIAGMVKAIQAFSHSTVSTMSSGVQKIEADQYLAVNASDALREIMEAAQQVKGMIDAMASAASQQALATSEISKSVEHVSAVTQETAAGASEIAKAAEDLNRQAENLQSTIAAFRI